MEYRYTVNRILCQTADELRSVAHEEAEIEARELVMHSLGVESRAELAGGCILILMGVKILIEHLMG